ncbi:PREDICTED: rho guanine nucleotide exchange factor 33 [Gekko japonicus]|uniref:Rho guanine nucleotide exchange factor 33 n=1 Tax=Gekko japonicus TaxID=146911 RepID=A0ABM1KIK6_GEKJA|nr:PREDICTED: rho guanine nucleotide exchange factor 33 [Gekko japonicus]
MDSNRKAGETESVPVINPSTQIAQLQALASELKTGFTEAMQELSRIQHGEYALEEKVQSCRCAMEEKVAEMKNSLNCFKEELNDAKSMIEEISTKQEEMQQKIEQLQQEKKKESRKLKAKRIQKEEHGSQTVPTPLQGSPFRSLNLPEPVLINEDFVNLLHNATYEKVADCRPLARGEGNVKGIMGTNLDTEERPSLSTDAQSKGHSSSMVWKQPKDSKEWSDEHISKEQTDRQKEVSPSRYSSIENVLREPSIAAKRQNIALDLLESERKYVVSLSLILKIKATLHGPEMKRNTKERSFFPNSLRYLAQQHVDLLHALQERVLSWPRQGILGDIFLKLTNDENNFLDYYVAYLRDLPECISLIHIVVLKEIEEEIRSDLYIFFFHIVQRIPEYLLHLQNILKYTEQEHPDYYLLLVCVQRLRVFISHHSLLFQCNEDLLIQKRKKLKKSSFVKLYKGLASQCGSTGPEVSPTLSATSIRDSGIHSEEAMQLFPSAPASGTTAMHLMSHMKKSQQQGVESMQGTPQSEWETDSRRHDRAENVLTPSQFSEQDLKALAASLQAFPDLEYNAPPSDTKGNPERLRRASADLLQDSTSFAPDYEDFEYRGDSYAMPGPYEEESSQNLAIFETCSPASSESSIDICFLRPVNFTTEPERTEHTVQPLPKSCAPVSSSTYKRDVFRSKGKQLSRSLKEFPRSGTEGMSSRLYSTRSSSGSRLQGKQERGFQSHMAPASSRSSQRNYFPPQRGAGEKQSFLEEMHLEDNTRFSHRDDNEQTSFSNHNPRQEQKGGFRSSFRKLFKKK